MLNSMYSKFDRLTSVHEVYKVSVCKPWGCATPRQGRGSGLSLPDPPWSAVWCGWEWGEQVELKEDWSYFRNFSLCRNPFRILSTKVSFKGTLFSQGIILPLEFSKKSNLNTICLIHNHTRTQELRLLWNLFLPEAERPLGSLMVVCGTIFLFTPSLMLLILLTDNHQL